MILAEGVCQVGHQKVEALTCPERESGGYQCERLDPHGSNGHVIGQHTIDHALRGSGYVCDGHKLIGVMGIGDYWPS